MVSNIRKLEFEMAKPYIVASAQLSAVQLAVSCVQVPSQFQKRCLSERAEQEACFNPANTCNYAVSYYKVSINR